MLSLIIKCSVHQVFFMFMHKIIDTPFDCENAAQIMLETIRAKASKIENSSSHCLTSKLENPEMLDINHKC